MREVRIGCTGWGYDDWVGPFYAPGTPAGEYLAAYSRAFRFTEVDSSFHQAPPPERIERWARDTPAGFVFALKLPGAITHEARLAGAERPLEAFLASLDPLRRAGKLGPLVAQMPPSFRRASGEAALKGFLAAWPREFELAVEFRDASWWSEEVFGLLREAQATLVWSTNETGRTPPVLTTSTLYARLVGDRALDATGGRWTRVQRDQSTEIAYWRERILEAFPAMRVFVVANNHFMGYAPETAQQVARALGEKPFDLAAAGRRGNQRGLGEFH